MPYADLSNPQTFNQYAYVHNNHMTFGDPDGHDGVGGVLEKAVEYVEDGLAKLVDSAEGAAGFTYTYDADGNRVEKANGATGTLYWYMTPGIVGESDLSGNLKSEYVFFSGERVARKDFPET